MLHPSLPCRIVLESHPYVPCRPSLRTLPIIRRGAPGGRVGASALYSSRLVNCVVWVLVRWRGGAKVDEAQDERTLVSFHARCLPLWTKVLPGLSHRNNPAVGEFDTACGWFQRHRVSWSCNVAVATPVCNGEPRGRWTQWLMRWDASGRGRPRLTRGSIGSE